MNARNNKWILIALLNLSIVALLGFTLRTKFLFPISFIDYKNLLSAHSHFAFGGWVTLALMFLFVNRLLPANEPVRKAYTVIFWGIEITSVGMLLSFPFQGYAFFSILFSTAFIFFTYAFSWYFIKDIHRSVNERSVVWLSVFALLYLVISSAGPFTLAWMMATKSGNTILYHDSIYTYLHFQYNGFFSLSVFALLIKHLAPKLQEELMKKAWLFSITLALSVLPSLFLSLTWHTKIPAVFALALLGCAMALLSLFFFFRFIFSLTRVHKFNVPHARIFWAMAMLSFAIKMILQTGTIIPELAHTVFGYRPIIIGFLHLVFLGLVSFSIFAQLAEAGELDRKNPFSNAGLIIFSSAVILNEIILLVQGIGLLLQVNNEIYPWLLWIAALLLFSGASLIFYGQWQHKKRAAW